MASRRNFAPLLLLLTAILWSLGGVLIKSVNWNPMAIAGTRSALALPLIFLCLDQRSWRFSRQQWAGAIAYSATVILFVCATRLTTAANAIFLQYTAPIYVALLAPRLLGERALRSDWVVLAAALAGIALFFFDHLSLSGWAGNACALASGFAFAATALCLRLQKDHSPLSSIFLGNVLTAGVGLPFAIGHCPDQKAWLSLGLLGVVQLGLPYVLYSIAIKRVSALEAIMLPLLEPVLNPLWVMLAFGERPGFWATFGAAIVLGAVLFRSIFSVLARAQSSRLSQNAPQPINPI